MKMAEKKSLLPRSQFDVCEAQRCSQVVVNIHQISSKSSFRPEWTLREKPKPLHKGTLTPSSQSYPKLHSVPLIITAACILCFLANQSPFNQVDACLLLSYKRDSSPNDYGKGIRDICFITFYCNTILVLRQVLHPRLHLLVPNHHLAKNRQKLSEQLFQLLYFGLSAAYGVYVSMEQQLWSLDHATLFERWKSDRIDGFAKFLYMIETAWWMHEAITLLLGLERRRKDFWALVCHHMVTVVLITGSYWYNLTDYGLMIIVPHGATDALLSIAKIATYMQSKFTAASWYTFLLAWLYGRHYLMLRAIYSLAKLYNSPVEGAMTETTRFSIGLFLIGLTVLQVLNLYWLSLIIRGLRRASSSKDRAQDIRSEDEDSDE